MRTALRLAASVALVVPLALTGCTSSGGCPSFVWYDTPADALAEAFPVVIGVVVEQTGTTRMFAGEAHVWAVEVHRWLHGDGPARIEVVSTPPQCSGEDMYFGADPLAAAGSTESVLFLHDDDGRLRTITPLQGIVPAVDGGVPTVWPFPEPGASTGP